MICKLAPLKARAPQAPFRFKKSLFHQEAIVPNAVHMQHHGTIPSAEHNINHSKAGVFALRHQCQPGKDHKSVHKSVCVCFGQFKSLYLMPQQVTVHLP